MLAVTWLLHAASSNAHLEVTCPVHVPGPILDSCQHGQLLFEGVSSADALGVLRMLLGEIGVKDSKVYRTHDLRRGHALDLQLSGRAWHVHLLLGRGCSRPQEHPCIQY